MYTDVQIKEKAQIVLFHLRELRTMLTTLKSCGIHRLCRGVESGETKEDYIKFLIAHVGYISSRL
jgi:hypothetical protein